jgi:hypothetical protein
MRAALYTESERLRTLVLGGSVTNRYKCPTDDGMFAVSKVHVCEKWPKVVNGKFGMSVFSRTVRTSQPFSAFLRLASVRVLLSIPCNLERGGLGCEFGFRKDSRCLIAGGRCLTILKVPGWCGNNFKKAWESERPLLRDFFFLMR